VSTALWGTRRPAVEVEVEVEVEVAARALWPVAANASRLPIPAARAAAAGRAGVVRRVLMIVFSPWSVWLPRQV
jgi:hypothetical protein